jgi:hypothetical protein
MINKKNYSLVPKKNIGNLSNVANEVFGKIDPKEAY